MTKNTSLDQIIKAEQQSAKMIDDAKAKNITEISLIKQEMEIKINRAAELIEKDKQSIVVETKKKIENIRTEAKTYLDAEISKINNISENKKEAALKLIINMALAE